MEILKKDDLVDFTKAINKFDLEIYEDDAYREEMKFKKSLSVFLGVIFGQRLSTLESFNAAKDNLPDIIPLYFMDIDNVYETLEGRELGKKFSIKHPNYIRLYFFLGKDTNKLYVYPEICVGAMASNYMNLPYDQHSFSAHDMFKSAECYVRNALSSYIHALINKIPGRERDISEFANFMDGTISDQGFNRRSIFNSKSNGYAISLISFKKLSYVFLLAATKNVEKLSDLLVDIVNNYPEYVVHIAAPKCQLDEYGRFILKINNPSVERDTDNLDKDTFDFVRVMVSIPDKDTMNNAEVMSMYKKYKDRLMKDVLEKISNSRSFKKYNVPINFLRLSRSTVTSSREIMLLFELKRISGEG